MAGQGVGSRMTGHAKGDTGNTAENHKSSTHRNDARLYGISSVCQSHSKVIMRKPYPQPDTASRSAASPVRSASKKPTRHRRGFFHGRHSADNEEVEGTSRRKASISDSGPFIFAFGPNTGTTRLQQNPHWPNENSWKREEEDEWAVARLGRSAGVGHAQKHGIGCGCGPGVDDICTSDDRNEKIRRPRHDVTWRPDRTACTFRGSPVRLARTHFGQARCVWVGHTEVTRC